MDIKECYRKMGGNFDDVCSVWETKVLSSAL